MPTEHIILCGVVNRPQSGDHPLALNIYGQKPNVNFRLEELRRDLWREIPPVLRDLLDLAAYVYTADQAVRRAGGGSIDATELGAGWRREFRFCIPVRLPDLWNTSPVRDALIETLSFLSEDTYEFEFTRLEKDTSLDGFVNFSQTPYHGQIDEVVMFSGGLDSLAGALTESLVAHQRVLLVNHRSNEKLTRRHTELLRGITERVGENAPLHFPVRMNKAKRQGLEYTQRTRSFLFATFGVLFAHMIGLSRLRFYENGVVSLNLPPSAQVVGARASRTTHPRVLAGFATLFTALLGCKFAVENPFQWDTKTDVVKRIVDTGSANLIRYSTSCGHTWERTGQRTHCGVCSQCIDRRFAVLAVGQEAHDPAEAYEVDLLVGPRRKGEPKTMLAAYIDMANRVERMGEGEFRTQFGELSRALPHLGLPPTVGAARVFDLYKRHAQQVNAAIDQAIATHARAIRRHELPRNCLLRLVVDQLPPGGDTPDAADPAPPKPAGNYFVRRKRFWVIRYGMGEENYYPMDRGFDYLRILLAHPDQQFTVSELAACAASGNIGDAPRTVSLAEAVAGGVGVSALPSGDDALDTEAREAIQSRLSEVAALRATLTRDSPERIDQIDELEAEENRLETRLHKDQGLRGRSRKLGDLPNRVRNRVCIAIRRAIELIDEDDKPLAEHLKKPTLTTGNTVMYQPKTDVRWTMEG